MVSGTVAAIAGNEGHIASSGGAQACDLRYRGGAGRTGERTQSLTGWRGGGTLASCVPLTRFLLGNGIDRIGHGLEPAFGYPFTAQIGEAIGPLGNFRQGAFYPSEARDIPADQVAF